MLPNVVSILGGQMHRRRILTRCSVLKAALFVVAAGWAGWWALTVAYQSSAWRAVISSARYDTATSGEAACGRDSSSGVGWRRLTTEPGYHFFGYFDKSPRSSNGQYVLAHRAHFHGRRVRAEDAVAVGVFDTHVTPPRWHFLATTRAWNWQQGAMLQWLGGSKNRDGGLVIFNARRDFSSGGGFGSIVMDWREQRVVRELPHAVYSISPDGRWAACIDPGWLHSFTEDEGYGYPPAAVEGKGEEGEEKKHSNHAGLRIMEIRTGRSRLVLPIRSLRRYRPWSLEHGASAAAAAHFSAGLHFVNHAQWSADGRRIGMLHRWIASKRRQSKFKTRFVALQVWPDDVAAEARTLRLAAAPLLPQTQSLWAFDTGERGASHFQWRPAMREPCAPSVVYPPAAVYTSTLILTLPTESGAEAYLIDTAQRTARRVVLTGRDGHPTISPDGRWLAMDSYRNELGVVDMCAVDAALRDAPVVRRAADAAAAAASVAVLPAQTPRVALAPLLKWRRFEPLRRHFTVLEDVRTDLHPRFSPDGRSISVDAEGPPGRSGGVPCGRQMWTLDVAMLRDVVENRAED